MKIHYQPLSGFLGQHRVHLIFLNTGNWKFALLCFLWILLVQYSAVWYKCVSNERGCSSLQIGGVVA